MANNSTGEEAIPQPVIQQVAGDIAPEQIHQKLASTISEKEKLDYIFKGIAQKAGAKFDSRIKNPDTVIRKIAQKRIEGRKYGLDDINDGYGGRFIITDPKAKSQITSMLEKAESLGLFKINKSEPVKNDTYHAFHIDFMLPSGVKGEAQIMTPQESLESVANHSLRAVHGENPPDNVQELRDKQAQLAKKTPHGEAMQKAQEIQQTSKQIDGKPLDPRIIASILAK